MQYGDEHPTTADYARHAAGDALEQVRELRAEVVQLKLRSPAEAAWALAQEAAAGLVGLRAELARERARVDLLRDLLVSYGIRRELYPELWDE